MCHRLPPNGNLTEQQVFNGFGCTGEFFTLPIYDADGRLIDLRRFGPGEKLKSAPGGRAGLFQVARLLDQMSDVIIQVAKVYEKAGAFRPFEDGEELAPGLRAISAQGHTGGHTVYAFTSEGRELWCLGDLIHFGAVQFQRPEVGVAFDLDGDRAVKIRQQLFREAARRQVVLAGAHLPQIVRIIPKGGGYEAVPVP